MTEQKVHFDEVSVTPPSHNSLDLSPKVKQKSIMSHNTKQKLKKLNKVISKEHPEFELTIDMMLGIRTAFSRSMNEVPKEKLEVADFSEEYSIRMPSEGSSTTPPHKMNDFKFKDYAPKVFRHIRQRFGIDPVDYMLCVCGNFEFLEFISNSKSGMFFFYTHDRQFMIKTQTDAESKLLRQLLPAYYKHVMENPNTLITRFYGMHRVKPHKRSTMHFVIMGSVFYTDKYVHEVFDLKGSTHGRSATAKEKSQTCPVLKDNDWTERGMKLNIGEKRADLFLKQLERDLDFLRRLNIMDYSLLLGIHYTNRDIPKELIEEEEEKSVETKSLNDIIVPTAISLDNNQSAAPVLTKQRSNETQLLKILKEKNGKNGLDNAGNNNSDITFKLELVDFVAPEKITSTTDLDSPGILVPATPEKSSMLPSSPNVTDATFDGSELKSPSPDPQKRDKEYEASVKRRQSNFGIKKNRFALAPVPNAIIVSSVPDIFNEPIGEVAVEEEPLPGPVAEIRANLAAEKSKKEFLAPPVLDPNSLFVASTPKTKASKERNNSFSRPASVRRASTVQTVTSIFNVDSGGFAAGDDTINFVGIIDILQLYNAQKKAEHFFKQFSYGKTCSCQDPDFYAERMLNFFKDNVQ